MKFHLSSGASSRWSIRFAAIFMLIVLPTTSARADSIAEVWNEQLLEAIRNDTARPTVHARNLFHTAIAMYDAWAAYDNVAAQYLHNESATAVDVAAAREEAISYAAYRLLKHRFVDGPGGVGPGRFQTWFDLDSQMVDLGYDINNTSTVGDSPAALGNRIAQSVINFGLSDGANEPGNYADPTGYTPVNDPMTFDIPGTEMNDPNRWQPLTFLRERIDQGGTVIDEQTQVFLSPYWGQVSPFAMTEADRGSSTGVYKDLGAPPQPNGVGDQQFRDSFVEVITFSSQLDPFNNDVMVDISPVTKGNRVLGTYEDVGYDVNPYTGLPYEPNIIKQADWGRLIAEFWADGPDSEAPPGHWHVLFNEVHDKLNDLNIPLQIGGSGPVVDDLEFDAKGYLALAGAVHDAAIAAWNHKGYYDYSRPVSMIRYMGGLGQSTDDTKPNYDVNGLPLIDGLIEEITSESTMPGGKHEHLAGHEGEIAIFTWQGPPEEEIHDDPTDIGGVGWILAEVWLPYQRDTFVTPPFAAYVSGHSTFSRSSAEVLAALTGSEYFPGGIGEFTFPVGDGLFFEYGPTEEVTLQWATYFDAADEAGLSRLYGGIHVRADDLPGRMIGSEIGQAAWEKAMQYYMGIPEPASASLLILGAATLLRRRH